MSDLISRKQAIDYIKTQRGRPFIGITLEEAIIMMIEEVPSAETERKTGRWIPITFSEMTGYNPKLSGDDPIYGHRCSACNNECFVDDSGSDILSDFCPNCGAKMEGTKCE